MPRPVLTYHCCISCLFATFTEITFITPQLQYGLHVMIISKLPTHRHYCVPPGHLGRDNLNDLLLASGLLSD